MSDPASEPVNKANLFRHLDESWRQLQSFLSALSHEQLVNARDTNDWSISDFIVHLACWEQGIAGVLRKQSFADALGVDKEDFDQGADRINAILRQRYLDTQYDEAVEMLRQSHTQLIAAVQYLTDEDLLRPIHYFDPDSTDEQPIIWLIVGNSFGHYAEHLVWLAEMVNANG